MKKSTALQFAVLCGVPFVMVLGNSMLIPVFPQMKDAMSLTQFQVGLIITFFSLPAGMLIPFAGFLSDRFGRKVIIVPALFLYGFGGLVSGFAALLLENPFPILLAGRVLQGLGAGGTYQLAMALTGDIFQSEERTKALGLLEASNGLGKVISPILGALVAGIVWYAPFFLYSIVTYPIALGVWFLVKEPKHERTKESLKEYWQKLCDVFKQKGKVLLASYFSGMVVLFTLFGVMSWVSDILESEHHIYGLTKGFVLAIPVTAMAVTSYLSGMWLTKQPQWSKAAIIAGTTGVTAVLLLTALFTKIYPFMLMLLLLGVCIGAVLPPVNAIITGATKADKRGIVTSLYGTVRFFGVAIGPPLFGLAVQHGRWTMFIGAAVITAAAAAAAFLITTPQRQE
ncbi:MAG TPA: MFS transporter [Firmicutes bacterium]|nr:MFS transporter [Bacillota bacterium]